MSARRTQGRTLEVVKRWQLDQLLPISVSRLFGAAKENRPDERLERQSRPRSSESYLQKLSSPWIARRELTQEQALEVGTLIKWFAKLEELQESAKIRRRVDDGRTRTYPTAICL